MTAEPSTPPEARALALAWLAANADRLRAAPWRLTREHGPTLDGALRAVIAGRPGATPCPLSYPTDAIAYEYLAARHGLPDAVARRLTEAADGCLTADPAIRAALLRELAPAR